MLQLIEISLICAGIHVCFLEGMIFGGIAKVIIDSIIKICIIQFVWTIWIILLLFRLSVDLRKFHNNTFEWITKPLYDCLPCMASFWTCIILWKIDIKSMLIVCGMNAIIASLLQFFDNTKLPEND